MMNERRLRSHPGRFQQLLLLLQLMLLLLLLLEQQLLLFLQLRLASALSLCPHFCLDFGKSTCARSGVINHPFTYRLCL